MKIVLLSIIFVVIVHGIHGQTPAPSNIKLPVSKAVSTGYNVNLSLIDPAVTNITFVTIKLTSGDKMRVTGIVKNVGGKNFESSENQQVVQLWELRSATEKQKLKEISFVRLNAGQELKISIDLPALKPGKEFPPDYQVMIVYDPDILMDANKNNDDANYKNNTLLKNPFN